MPIVWTKDLNTGIEVIDRQHRQIVDFINNLKVARKSNNRDQIKKVFNDCLDYTQSHFTFEESLQEEAGYPYCKPHKKVHELFIRRLSEYQTRLEQGEDVAEELHHLLSRWLISHIKRDDADYVPSVKRNMVSIAKTTETKKEASWFKRLFG
jgi:hemerythrin